MRKNLGHIPHKRNENYVDRNACMCYFQNTANIQQCSLEYVLRSGAEAEEH